MTDYEVREPKDILEDRRERAIKVAEEKRRALMEEEPEYGEIEKEINKAGLESVKAAFEHKKEEAKKAKEKLEKLVEKEKKFLRDKGYGDGYLQPEYHCKKCLDTGMVNGEKCSCYKQLILDNWKALSGISSEENTFDKFDLKMYSNEANPDKYECEMSPRKQAEWNLKIARDFTENFGKNKKDLFFTGQAGLGKTFLCSCIAEELIKQDINVMYISAYRLFNTISSFNMTEEEKAKGAELGEMARRTPVLIIDDLGAENTSEARKSFLVDLLNQRESMNCIYPCKTIISTNLSLKEFYEVYGERIGSRIVGRFEIVRFLGEDIRMKKNRR